MASNSSTDCSAMFDKQVLCKYIVVINDRQTNHNVQQEWINWGSHDKLFEVTGNSRQFYSRYSMSSSKYKHWHHSRVINYYHQNISFNSHFKILQFLLQFLLFKTINFPPDSAIEAALIWSIPVPLELTPWLVMELDKQFGSIKYIFWIKWLIYLCL